MAERAGRSNVAAGGLRHSELLFEFFHEQLRPVVLSVISLTLLTGCIFPLALFA
jgi:hypothetical protein